MSANLGIGGATLPWMDSPRRREELAQFLRARRASVTLEMAGLPVGRRRRSPGLRPEEVAQLADVGVTWYTWLEQGRDIRNARDRFSRSVRLGKMPNTATSSFRAMVVPYVAPY